MTYVRGSSVVEFKIVEVCGFVDHRGRVCGRGRGRQGAYLDEEFPMELKMKHEKFLLHCDNQSVIRLAKNIAYHSQTKHIQRRYHWLREKVEDKEFALVKIHTDNNGSDMLTKNLPMDRLIVYRQRTELADSFPHE